MRKTISLRRPWLYIITAFCLAALASGPLFGDLKAEASVSAAAAAVDGGEDCEDQLFATLRGPTIDGEMPRGFAKYKLDDDDRTSDNDNRLKVFVRNVNLPEDTLLRVYVDDEFIGTITLRHNGNAHRFFDPDEDIEPGSVIEVRSEVDIILSGTFRHCDETGTPTNTPTPTPVCFTITTLSGAQEVPPNGSTGAAVGTISLSPDHTTITAALSFSGLSSNAVAAHIHGPAGPGINAPVIFPFTGVPASTGGLIASHTFPATPTQLDYFLAGLMYFNIHTSNFPGGEVRGQILPASGCASTPTNTPTPTFTPTAPPTPAQPRLFFARLRGGNVVPPVETNARGFAGVMSNAAATQIQVAAFFFNLSSNQTAASINCPAIPGQNAPAVINLGSVGTRDGLLTGTFNVSPLDIAELQGGLCYLVVGSQDYPDGEIRGQLVNRHLHRDFDGDGRSDIALFRPSNGTWYYKNSSDNTFAAGHFGMAGDKPMASDFDGDGKGDLAVFRNVGGFGMWYVQNSSDGSFVSRQWGLGDDIPMSGDFDGDGRTDVTVFRPSNGTWYISRSSDGSLSAIHWGQTGDIPIVGDYDGDGLDDVTVFRPATGIWYVNRSSSGTFAAIRWGLSADIPVAGDFDDDGLADIAVFRPSNGNWYIQGSRGSLISVHFGMAGDIPVAGRFDSDNKTDMAVFRPSEGNWYVLNSQTNTVTATNFGTVGDIPIMSY